MSVAINVYGPVTINVTTDVFNVYCGAVLGGEGGGGGEGSNILMETGDALLLESGDNLLME